MSAGRSSPSGQSAIFTSIVKPCPDACKRFAMASCTALCLREKLFRAQHGKWSSNRSQGRPQLGHVPSSSGPGNRYILNHHFIAKEQSLEEIFVRSGALGVTDIHEVPNPVACSSRRAWSRGVDLWLSQLHQSNASGAIWRAQL